MYSLSAKAPTQIRLPVVAASMMAAVAAAAGVPAVVVPDAVACAYVAADALYPLIEHWHRLYSRPEVSEMPQI